MVREHDRNELNLRDLQETIQKEVRVFKSELVTSRPPQHLHPTVIFHTGATNNPFQPNAASQRSCAANHCSTNTKPKQEATHRFSTSQRLQLTHPVTSTEQFTINLLIGADHYWDVVEDHIIKGNGPMAMGSKLGYLLSGPVGAATPRNTTTNILHVASQPIPDPDLQRFWTVESLGIMPKDHSTKSFMELYMTNSIERLPNGSYSVCFPWKESHPALPTNFWTWAHQTRSLAHNLAKTPPLLSKYNEILADQQRYGFIE